MQARNGARKAIRDFRGCRFAYGADPPHDGLRTMTARDALDRTVGHCHNTRGASGRGCASMQSIRASRYEDCGWHRPQDRTDGNPVCRQIPGERGSLTASGKARCSPAVSSSRRSTQVPPPARRLADGSSSLQHVARAASAHEAGDGNSQKSYCTHSCDALTCTFGRAWFSYHRGHE